MLADGQVLETRPGEPASAGGQAGRLQYHAPIAFMHGSG